MTKEEIAKILKILRLNAGLTQKEAAQKIGRKQQTLASWEIGQSQPDANTLFNLCEIYGTTVDNAFGFNKENNKHNEMILKYNALDTIGKKAVTSILDIEYERYTETIKPTPEPKAIPKVIEFDPEEVETITLKHSEYKASAGTGYILFDDCLEEDLKVVFNNLTRKADICIDVYGNSMEPKYHDKDILLVRKQPDVEIGEIGIFIIDDKGFVKKKGTEGLISINKDYDIIPKSEDIKCFGKVLGVLEKEWIV